MDDGLKKYYHKYKYLSIEIEDFQKEIEGLQQKWYNTYRDRLEKSPRYVENEQELHQNNEDPPKTDNKNLKPLYKKLSKKLHPDRGGNNEEFVKFKEEYEKGNYFGLTELAVENDIELDGYEIGIDEYKDQIQTLEKELKELKNNTFWWFYNGTPTQQQMAKYYLEQFYNTKIFEDIQRDDTAKD